MEKAIEAFTTITGISWLLIILVVWLSAAISYAASKNETLRTFVVTLLISSPFALTAALIVMKIFW